MLGQLPIERVTPDPVFNKVGFNHAGSVLIKYGYIWKPTIVKAYVCIFVSLTMKAIHLELVSDLTSDAFIACLRRFIARRGCPSLIWSDSGTNFVGAACEIKELYHFLRKIKGPKMLWLASSPPGTYHLEVHSAICCSFRWPLGGSCQIYEDTPQASGRRCQTHF